MFYNHILSIILFTPMVGVLVLLFMPKENKNAIRVVANVFAVAGLLVSIPLVPWFWALKDNPGFKFVEGAPNTGSPPLAPGTTWASTASASC